MLRHLRRMAALVLALLFASSSLPCGCLGMARAATGESHCSPGSVAGDAWRPAAHDCGCACVTSRDNEAGVRPGVLAASACATDLAVQAAGAPRPSPFLTQGSGSPPTVSPPVAPPRVLRI